MNAPRGLRETELYAPVKAFLEAQGYVVKGEIGAADIVALRDGDPPVVVELKTAFSLALFHQAVARQQVTDAVYVAVPKVKSRRAFRDNLKLARLLGLGVLTVRLPDGTVETHCDPGPYRPRSAPAHKGRLLREFQRRVGDPTPGGSARVGIVTAYRQDALRCLACLVASGPSKGALVAATASVPGATRIMADDHYGWFERVARGIYDITPKGREAMTSYADEIARLTDTKPSP